MMLVCAISPQQISSSISAKETSPRARSQDSDFGYINTVSAWYQTIYDLGLAACFLFNILHGWYMQADTGGRQTQDA